MSEPLLVAEDLEREYRIGPEPVRVLRGGEPRPSTRARRGPHRRVGCRQVHPAAPAGHARSADERARALRRRGRLRPVGGGAGALRRTEVGLRLPVLQPAGRDEAHLGAAQAGRAAWVRADASSPSRARWSARRGWSRVFPTPDAPMIAMLSPALTVRLTPRRTRTGSGPIRYSALQLLPAHQHR